MASPAMRLRILPRFPTRVEAVEPVFLTKTAGTYTFSWDYRGIATEAAPDMGLYVLLQDGATGTFYRTELSDLPTGATDWTNIQNRPAQIDGLAVLATTSGALEQTGANTFAIRAIGDSSGPSLVTFTQATGLFQPLNSALSTIATNGGVATASIANDAVTFAKMQNIATARLLGRSTASSGDVEEITVGAGLTLSAGELSSSATAATGSVINSVYAEYTTNASVAPNTPIDDTIPQVGEGTQIISQAITPSSTANKLRARFRGTMAPASAGAWLIPAMFVNGAANAVAANATLGATAGGGYDVTLEYEFTPGVTSAQTFTIRVGASTGNVALNGATTGRYLGGAQRATLVVEEIKA